MTSKRLSIVEAARLLYRTDAPSDQQMWRVFERMKAGAIRVIDRQSAPRDWTTTERALADYVAAEMVKRHGGGTIAEAKTIVSTKPTRPVAQGKQTAHRLPPSRTPSGQDSQNLQQVYHSIWRDAFLAVLLRRRIAHRSATFHRWALAGQILLLIALPGTAAGLVRTTTERAPPEHAAIERWIEANTDFYDVQQFCPGRPSPDGTGTIIEVEYRYTKDSRRVITTRRTLLVVDDEVGEIITE